MRVAVVGGGINGLCTAWALVRGGHEAVVLDAAPIPNTEGTSYDEHRLTRIPYGSQAGYTRMMPGSFAAWDMLWRDLGAVHYARTGCLALCTSEGDWTGRSAETLDRFGILWERLESGALADRFPMLQTGDARFGLYMAEGGVLFADRIVDALTAWLAAHGVELRGGTRIAELRPDVPAAVTETGEQIRADAMVIAAGAWAEQLFPGLQGHCTTLRQVVAYVEPPPALAAAWQSAPVMLDLGGPRGMYLAPPVRGRGMKIGCGALNRPCGLAENAAAQPEDGLALLGVYRGRLARWEEFRVRRLRMCRYANEEAQRFVLRRSGAAWALTGCSGHGFKFGPLMGLGLAAVASGGIADDAAARWAAGDLPDMQVPGLDMPHAAAPLAAE